jgi:hypothetical protein
MKKILVLASNPRKDLNLDDEIRSDLPIIQKTYDLIKWYIPILNRLPRDHKFMLGDRMINELYNLGTPDLGGF